MMNEDDFEDWLDRHGGEVSRWPAARRQEAAALLARSGAARALLAETAAMERLLRLRTLTENSLPARRGMEDAPAARRMAERAMRGPQARPARWPLRPGSLAGGASGFGGLARSAVAGLGLAAALVLAAGLALGLHRAGGAADGLDEAPAQLVASALGPRGDAGALAGAATGEAGSDVD